MFQSVRPVRHLRVLLKSATLAMGFALLGGCTLEGALETASLQLAASPTGETHTIPRPDGLAAAHVRARARVDRWPMPAADQPVRSHPQGARAGRIPRLPRAARRESARRHGCSVRSRSCTSTRSIEVAARQSCAPRTLRWQGVLEELLREGYHTQSVALFAGSAVMTLRTERIDRSLNVLKGSCRFNLDPKCVDFNVWLQEDQRSGEPCGFAQTRVFVAAATAPDFVGAASFAPAEAAPVAGVEALRLAAFDAAAVRVYALLYVHKICRNEMVLVRNG